MDKKSVKTAFRRVLDECPSNGFGGYAKSYAITGLLLETEEELNSQILYVLENLKYWRGDAAREVKAALKKEL